MTDVHLPAISANTLPVLDQLTKALGIPREILASQSEIETAWTNLPGILKKIPPALRTEGMARMCVAVASGLFDSAINYIWNCSIIELREKVKRFGLNVVEQITGKTSFDEQALLDLKDAELLSLCLKLNLITEDGYFSSFQCRDIRNNFSAAHPVVGRLMTTNSSVLQTAAPSTHWAMSTTRSASISPHSWRPSKGGKFSPEQKDQWAHRIQKTHEAQQYLIFGSLHSIYSDPARSNEEARVNALSVAADFAPHFTPKARSDLINRHHDYIAKGDEKRHKGMRQFFRKLGMLAPAWGA